MSGVKGRNKCGVVECSGKAPRAKTNIDKELEGWKDLIQWRGMRNNVRRALGIRLEGLFRVVGRKFWKPYPFTCYGHKRFALLLSQ